jgi:hypothetical protein
MSAPKNLNLRQLPLSTPNAMSQEQNQRIQSIISTNGNEGAKIDQIAKVRGWFRPEDNSAFYPVIQDYLNQQIDLDEASEKLFDPIDAKIAANKLDDVNFMDLWDSVIHSARRLSYHEKENQYRLAELVVAFKNHSVSDNEKYNYLYSSMTDFSIACREAYNDTPEPGSAVDVEINAWANLNYFYGLVAGKDIFDLSLYAIWVLRQALETPHEDDPQSTAVQKYNTYVPAAAALVFGMHQALYKLEKDLTPADKKHGGNPAKGGPLWKGVAEFSKDRWSFWSERFAEIGKMESVSEETRSVARDAVQDMERAATFEVVCN